MKYDNKEISFLKTRFGLFLSFVVFLILIFGFISIFSKMRVAIKNKKQEQLKLEAYKKEEQLIKKRLEDITSPDGFEKNIRENYGLVKDGEGVVVIIEEKDEESDVVLENDKFNMRDFLRHILGSLKKD